MLVLPVRPGEVTTITTPTGDIISVLLTDHRSSLDEPLLGFSAPEDHVILRDRIKERMQPELENITLYKVSSLQNRDEIIAAHETCDVVDLYRKRYPERSDIGLTEIGFIDEPYRHAQLVKCLLLQMKPPFFVEMDG